MTEFVDYYDILELPENCTQKEIKNAFYRLAKIHHPDQGGNKIIFQQITDAYETLYNKESRNEYDSLYQMNKNKEFNDNGFFTLMKEHRDFVNNNFKELTTEEIDEIYGTQFKPSTRDTEFKTDELIGRINDIKLEKKNLEHEFEDTTLNNFIKENEKVDVNLLMEYICQQKPKTSEIVPFDNIGGIDSLSSGYFSSNASMFNDDYASASSGMYSNISAFDANGISNSTNVDFSGFDKWKKSKVEQDKLKDDEIKSYRDKRREEDAEIKRILEENSKHREGGDNNLLGWKK